MLVPGAGRSDRWIESAPAEHRSRGSHAELKPFQLVAALRATAATNALDHQADIAKVQEWLGHAFKVAY